MSAVLLPLLLPAIADAGKVLVYSPGVSYSHLISNGRVADALVRAGHDVVMFIPEYTNLGDFNGTKLAKVVRMNYISSSLDGTMNDEEQRRWMAQPHIPLRERYSFEYVAAEMCSDLMARRDELEELRNYGFDVAFTEQLELCGVGVIRYLGIHNLLWLSSTTIMDSISYNLGIPSPTSYVPTIEENDKSDVMTFWERAYNMFMYLAAITIHRKGTDLTTEVFRKIDPYFPHVREIAANASLAFINADEMFDLPRPIIHKNIYIGGLGIGKPEPLDQKFALLMNKGKKGVIILSMGSIASFHAFPNMVKEDFAKVFQSMPDYHFILKIAKGDNTTQSYFKNVPNSDFVEWLPQTDILAHPRLKLFIMHGGVNGVTEAMIRGVPIVVIPIFADQFRNGRTAEKRGTGKVILKQDLNEYTIRQSISEILQNESYKRNSLRISKLMREKPFSAEERLVKWTTFAIENGVLEELHVEGSRMNFIVYFNLDVIAAVILALCLITFVFVRVCKVFLRVVLAKKRKQE